ncbi:MAG: aminoacyl-tRNA hydrolase [Planctomycetaceae bacterium]|nr:aminoacyl-tRNA hydrolase [Planctomycetaceae bacterium]
MKLIVGLGNPGRKYEGTRHNVGFDVVSLLARRGGAGGVKKTFQGETTDITVGGERTMLLWPHTFMNRSGSSVVEARDFYKLTNADLLVICDDLNLPLGKLRLRAKGSAGGQKGLADIIRCAGGDEFARLRVGIGSPSDTHPDMDAADFVLGKFPKSEQTEMELAFQHAADAAELWVREGVAAAMNRYNGRD